MRGYPPSMIYWGNEVLCGLCFSDTGQGYKYTC